jgi:hypothetical protein
MSVEVKIGCEKFSVIGIARRPALSLLASHDIALNRPVVVVHFGSDKRLRQDESHSSGIRFAPGNLIRFHSGFDSSKVTAKLKIRMYFLAVRDATRMVSPRVVFHSSRCFALLLRRGDSPRPIAAIIGCRFHISKSSRLWSAAVRQPWAATSSAVTPVVLRDPLTIPAAIAIAPSANRSPR